MTAIKNVQLVATKLASWMEDDEQFVVVRNAKGRPLSLTSMRGKYQEEQMLFSYAADGITCTHINGDIESVLLPILLAEASSPTSTSTSLGISVSGNKTLTANDLQQIQDVLAAATLTIPSDAVLGIVASDRVTVGASQLTSGAVTWMAGAGVSPLRGSVPTAAQYLVSGLVHVGANEWAFL
jgi:hypothetical protein